MRFWEWYSVIASIVCWVIGAFIVDSTLSAEAEWLFAAIFLIGWACYYKLDRVLDRLDGK